MRGGTEMFSTEQSVIGFRPHARAVAATGAILATALLGACASPAATPSQQAALSNQKIGDICEETMSFDVSGFYFPKCVDYLRSHARSQTVAVNMAEPAEHRACLEAGLPDGSPEYQRCVQEMVQLDLGATHL
jgi:hypothetical protein